MSEEEIDKWLDNEYGVSYTRLEELHDFLIEQNMKYQDKIVNLQQENKQLKDDKKKAREYIDEYFEITEYGEYYFTHTFDESNMKKLYELLGDKE